MKHLVVLATLAMMTCVPAGASAKVCGGLLGGQCGKNEFCDFPQGAFCGAADATGICKRIPRATIGKYRPVCGCNEKTYRNTRNANAAGVSVAYQGKCKPPM